MKILAISMALFAALGAAPAMAAQASPGQGLGTAAQTPAATHNPNIANQVPPFRPGKAAPRSGVVPGGGKRTATSTANTRGGGTSRNPHK